MTELSLDCESASDIDLTKLGLGLDLYSTDSSTRILMAALYLHVGPTGGKSRLLRSMIGGKPAGHDRRSFMVRSA